MTKQTITQSQKRFNDSLGALFSSDNENHCDFVFLKSSTDIGVQRNNGRNGARLAPQSFLSYFKRLNQKAALTKKIFREFEVSSEVEEQKDFHQAQHQEASRILHLLQAYPQAFVVHLGGGHDHIYPLLEAFSQRFKKIIVINVDAHADTRTDTIFHSGTPFRQFAEKFTGEFTLLQVGLLEFANSASTLGPFSKGDLHVIWRHELKLKDKLSSAFEEIRKKIDSESAVIFSLDADALNGADMPGVSAVNGNGLDRMELDQIWKLYRSLNFCHPPIVGFYELNPVYDTLSMTSMRTLGTFLYEGLE